MTEEKKDVELDAEAGKVKLKRGDVGVLIEAKNEKEADRAIAEHEKER